MKKIYVVKYSGPFGFIKPWTAVRDSKKDSIFIFNYYFNSNVVRLSINIESSAKV